MTKSPQRPRAVRTPAREVAVPIGAAVLEVIELAYRARRPVLLEGPTGIGKSQIVSEFARTSGLECVVLDLSLLEPPDLVGLPYIEAGRTHYASPAELPTSGRGVLMLEELNRAEIPVMQPALQLLSARRLHGYELPEGWICVAAVNPEDGDYQVHHLDPALRSRFLQLSVCADRDAWLAWAARLDVHPVVARIVRAHEDAFEATSPRSWTNASDILHALLPSELPNRELVHAAMRGYLPTPWALLVGDELERDGDLVAMDVDAFLAADGAKRLARVVSELETARRVDAIAMLAAQLRRALGGAAASARIESGALGLSAIEALLAPLPGDLREQCLDGVAESRSAPALLRQLGFDAPSIASGYARSPLAELVQRWRAEGALHRVRLVVAVALRHVTRSRLGEAEAAASVANLEELARDAGPLAHELSLWVRARTGRS